MNKRNKRKVLLPDFEVGNEEKKKENKYSAINQTKLGNFDQFLLGHFVFENTGKYLIVGILILLYYVEKY